MKILQRNLNSSTFVVWEMKRNVSEVCVCSRCNILISVKTIKEMQGSVASGTHCINIQWCVSQIQQNFIMSIIVLGQHVSILIESSSGPSKKQIPAYQRCYARIWS